MKQNIKVSVIVPVYNVEKYLDRCVKSIVDQSYKDIEILLIDDGSQDSCGNKIDEWCNRDKRVKAIHRKNGGLSAARNTGIEKAMGSHLVFVDSDDWIHENMIENLVDALDYADIVCCGMIYTNGSSETDIKWFLEKKIVSGIDAIKMLVENSVFTSHIPKNIFPKSLFEQVRFPEGKIYEDIRTAHKLFIQVGKVCILPEHYYYYFERNDSITNIVKLNNRLEWFDALKERVEDLSGILTLEDKERVESQRAVVMSLAVVQNRFSRGEKEKYKNEMKVVKNFLRRNDIRKAVKKYATNSQYIYFCMARTFFYSANIIYRHTYKRKKE